MGGRAGDVAAPGAPMSAGLLAELYENHAAAVYGRCRYLLKDEAEAKDALQDVFVKVLQALPEFRAAASASTWVLRIATHHCLNLLRARKALWREQLRAAQADRRQETEGPDRRELVRVLLAAAAEKLAHRSQRSFATRWAPLAAAAAVALIAGTLLVRRPVETETVRSKGAASAQLFVQDRKGVHELAAGEPLADGAKLLLSLQPSGRKRAAVVLVEPGEASVIYQGPAVNGTLPEAFVWTGRGVATLLVVLSDSAVDATAIRSAADAPRGSDVLTVTLRR